MPLYEYECTACGHRFERIQKFSDPPVEMCPTCGEPKVEKLLSSPAIQFKGTGWYITDYARKGAAATDAKGSTSTDGTKESGESKESTKESKESRESKESKESRESKESATKKGSSDAGTSASSSSTSSTPSTPKASGE